MAQASTFQVVLGVGGFAIGLGGLFISGWGLHPSIVRARTERTATVETGNTDQAELGDHADTEPRALLDGADAKDAGALPAGDFEDGLPDLEMGKFT